VVQAAAVAPTAMAAPASTAADTEKPPTVRPPATDPVATPTFAAAAGSDCQRAARTGHIVPLTQYPGGLQVYKQVFPAAAAEGPEPRVHEGNLWLCVLSGKLRLVLGDRDLVLGPGEIAEFDTHTPHWKGSADSRPVEILNLFGPQGERAHTTARTAAHDDGAAREH